MFVRGLQVLNHRLFLRKFSFTLISLIPQVERPITVAQFCPIALSNTIAKIISKILALILNQYLPSVISETQKCFCA
ncbi:hypothetical protein LIER_34274 [Lithospermum erythrorhizon]|uniref:Reverse transcriptase domain-containing protein n=1 Tax=Lithospermum erythrorhizon TaxID=34254 RepID=A0AAV3S3Y3_LITER